MAARQRPSGCVAVFAGEHGRSPGGGSVHLASARQQIIEAELALSSTGGPVSFQDHVDALANVLGDRNAGFSVQTLERLILLFRDVDRRRDLAARHGDRIHQSARNVW